MHLIDDQNVKLLSFGESNLNDMYKIIELAGRTCYKSLDRIEEGSAEKFVQRMINSDHTAMLEHGTIYLKIPRIIYDYDIRLTSDNVYTKYVYNKYSVVNSDDDYVYVTTNYRVINENNWEDDLVYISGYIVGKHEPRMTVVLTTNLQVSHELVRHRTLSYAQESSRYCNYSKNKFDNELNFIIPSFGKYNSLPSDGSVNKLPSIRSEAQIVWSQIMQSIEDGYMKLAAMGLNAQECAQVLPKATKTEIVVSGTWHDWQHFFDLRKYGTTGKPHPQMEEIANMVWNEFAKVGIEIPCSKGKCK